MGYKERQDMIKNMRADLDRARKLFDDLKGALDCVATWAAEIYGDAQDSASNMEDYFPARAQEILEKFDKFWEIEDPPDLSEVEGYLETAEEILNEVA